MQIIFTKPGRYKNDRKVTITIEQSDVDGKNIFDVYEKDAIDYIDAKKAVRAAEKVKPEKVKAVKEKEDK